MRSITMPSGAVLEVAAAPFADAKRLYQALLYELRGITVVSDSDKLGLLKEIFCAGFSSVNVERALQPCLSRCLYMGQKIADDLFEPTERRKDYLQVLLEVAAENVGPFAETLWSEWNTRLSALKAESQKSSPTKPTTPTT